MIAYMPYQFCSCTATYCNCRNRTEGTQSTGNRIIYEYSKPEPVELFPKKPKPMRPPKDFAERRKWWNR